MNRLAEAMEARRSHFGVYIGKNENDTQWESLLKTGREDRAL